MSDLQRLTAYPIYHIEASEMPFVWTEVFLREINRQPDQVIVHLWPLEKTVILGMLDKQVPYLEAGLTRIRSAGYQPLVRNLGGLAVVADEGVLNFSLFLPNSAQDKLEIKGAYQLMQALVQDILADQKVLVEAYEISDSYCPGSFDLSIRGKKFAGLAQRRIKDGIVVSIYISVSGDQAKRAQLVADFYAAGIGGKPTTVTYPEVNPEAMANLSDLCSEGFTVTAIRERLLVSLAKFGQSLRTYQVTLDNELTFERFAEQAGAEEL